MEREEKIKLILDESKKLGDILNGNFLKQFANMHNVSDDYNTLNVKQELIAERGFFPGVKKKYCLWIVNLEGVPVEEMENKGLIVRRSDYPEITKERIMKILEMLVKEEKLSIKNIREFVWDTREYFLRLIGEGSQKIARPVSFTKPLDEYKVIPGHVNGMLFWNEAEYNYFEPGTKGYSFSIKGIDMFSSSEKVLEAVSKQKIPNYIVMPFEEKTLPKHYQIDVDNTIAFSWDDRVKELLSPMWPQIDKTCSKNNIATF